MGLFSWLFPSPDDHLARAQRLAADGRWADARLAAQDAGDLPGAATLIAEAETTLCRANLDAAVSWAQAGDAERVRHHLEVAGGFLTPELQGELDDARRRIGELGAAQKAAHEAKEQAHAARLLEVDPRFHDGQPEDAIALPEGVSEDEADALKARLAILVDGWPDDLRGPALALGSDLIQAILDLEDGQAADALPRLLALPDTDAVVLDARARAAAMLGDAAAAARAWRQFAEIAGGHRTLGDRHTGVELSQALAASGEIAGAVDLMRELRETTPGLGGALWPALLHMNGQLPAADAAYRDLIGKHGKHPSLAVGLARVRVDGGHRVEAMRALEASLSETVCEPGKCGYRPPDLALHRLLATLYLEDGLDVQRGLELAHTAAGLVQRPTFEDAYLATLVAKTEGDPTWTERATTLLDALRPEDPRRAHLAAAI